MFWEGFIRSLQAEITTAIICLVFIGIAYAVLKRVTDDENFVKLGAKILVAIVLFFFLGGALVKGATNRTPRQDVDKSGVYEQMKENTK